MKKTRTQPPNMKGKKHFMFRCGCCDAWDCREEERERIALREAAQEAIERIETRKGEDIDEWAGRLAEDLAKFTD